ncbi:unnamed protein product [Cylindrotheca closterium]|uniref:Uncharacterized protein n=1 Tax=Cylindrotheca closterium TaxID=2856 RepID=A0AAD2CQX2_9STRA|nr:unnamed protein product [Cylindrotheca closterium]
MNGLQESNSNTLLISEDQSRRDVQKRDVQLKHHMSCTLVHTHVANGQAHQNGRLVCGVQPVILEDSALALLFFRKNMEAACATKDHFLTGGDKLWHGAPEFPRETSSRDATCPGPSALKKQELAAILMFVA